MNAPGVARRGPAGYEQLPARRIAVVDPSRGIGDRHPRVAPAELAGDRPPRRFGQLGIAPAAQMDVLRAARVVHPQHDRALEVEPDDRPQRSVYEEMTQR